VLDLRGFANVGRQRKTGEWPGAVKESCEKGSRYTLGEKEGLIPALGGGIPPSRAEVNPDISTGCASKLQREKGKSEQKKGGKKREGGRGKGEETCGLASRKSLISKRLA